MKRRAFLPTLAPVLGGPLFGQSFLPGIPNVGVTAQTAKPRSESGVGALMPWADALWLVNYNSHKANTGKGLGLHRIDERLQIERVHVHDGTHANRMVHEESDQCFIGPYAIDPRGKWRFIEALADHRLTGTMRHLTHPAEMVYMLSMEGVLFEVDVDTLEVRQLQDLTTGLGISQRPHFKGAHTSQGRVIVSNNGFYEYGDTSAGLWEWDGADWIRISNKPHMDIAGREDMGQVAFATGWDESSVLFHALVEGKWQHYRLPKASHAFEHAWQTEWMRIREVETEHYLVDIQGMFYELQPIPFEGRIWGVKPVCQHLRIIPDYCSFRGMLALGGNQTTANSDNNVVSGQPQAGVWFGKTDDLWSWGKPQGWGGPWRKANVRAETPSDPFLMTGFDKKVLHLAQDRGEAVEVRVEIDFLGNGGWHEYDSFALPADGYRFHEFPTGFSAHWVRLIASADAVLSAEFIYT